LEAPAAEEVLDGVICSREQFVLQMCLESGEGSRTFGNWRESYHFQETLHFYSMDANKAIYQDIPSDWQRRPDRPRQFWLATIHRDLRKLDIGLDNVPKLAADGVLWRGLICGA